MSTERVRRVLDIIKQCSRDELRQIVDGLPPIVEEVISEDVEAILLNRQYDHEIWQDNAGAVNVFSHHTISLQSKERNVTPDGPGDPITKESEPY